MNESHWFEQRCLATGIGANDRHHRADPLAGIGLRRPSGRRGSLVQPPRDLGALAERLEVGEDETV